MALTDKQRMFCKEYMIDMNATQSAIRAGYSETSARAIACDLLTKHNIQEYLNSLSKKRDERTEITADRVLKELAKIAFFNAGDILKEDGNTKQLKDWSRDDLASVQEITDNAITGDRKIKLSDKKAALDLLGRHLKLFTDKVQLSGEVGITFDLDYGINNANKIRSKPDST